MAIPSIKTIKKNSQYDPRVVFGNLAQTNYYQVNFSGFADQGPLGDLTKHLKGYAEGIDLKFVMDNTGLLCSEATLPGSSLATAEVKDNFMGIPQEYAHTRLYTDIDFTFYIDKDYNTLKFFEGWIDFISSGSENSSNNSPTANPYSTSYYRRMKYPDQYKCSTMSIVKFERDYNRGGNSLKYLFINAFPKTVTAVPVSYGGADILRVSVSFNYDRYIINPKSTQIEQNVSSGFDSKRTPASKELSMREVSTNQSLARKTDTLVPPPPPPPPKIPTPPTYKYDPSRNYGLSEGGGVVNFTSRGRSYYAEMDSSGDIVIKRAGLAGGVYGNETSTSEVGKDGTGRSAWLFEDLYKATRPSTGNFGQQYGPMASDARLKENIVKVGNSPSGIGIYEWNYKSAPNSRYQGVMAQEVMQIVPEAVYSEEDGFLSVYYDMLDVEVKLVSK